MLLVSTSSMADVVVGVVSAESDVASLSDNQVMDIFLGKTSHFPDGSRAVPVDQSEGSVERIAFYQEYSSKTPQQLKAHWSKIIFTGRGQPPKELKNSAQVKQYLSANPNAIGYMDKALIDDSMKIVLE